MAGLLPAESSNHGTSENRLYGSSHEGSDYVHSGSRWYFSRKEIEENSPSRRDGIDLKKETYLRKSYCTFLQDLGMRLKVPQVTIATAIIFCHRFFLRQSHAKNDRRTIATVCMFLAGKVEETPRPLKDVILVSYEIINKKDPAASQRIKQKEVYEQQKELILLGERVVLATLGFDLNVHHPYKPLVEAIKKFKVAQNALAQVAWNFVNDGLRTSLCLQYKPHHIAAGAIFLAAKFLKVKLPSDGEKVWWQEFDVTPRQLEDVSNQMLELYEQNRSVQASNGSEVDGSAGTITAYRSLKTTVVTEESASANIRSQTGGASNVKHGAPMLSSTKSSAEQSCNDTRVPPRGEAVEASSRPKSQTEHSVEDVETNQGTTEESGKWRDEGTSYNSSSNAIRNSKDSEAPKVHCLPDVMKKIDKDKVKAALEKRKKFRGDVPKNSDLVDEDDFIERELENGVELGSEDERTQQERRNWFKLSSRQEGTENQNFGKEKDGSLDRGNHAAAFNEERAGGRVNLRSYGPENGVILDPNLENAGELSSVDCEEPYPPKLDRYSGSQQSDYTRLSRDASRNSRPGYMERDSKRPRHETHV